MAILKFIWIYFISSFFIPSSEVIEMLDPELIEEQKILLCLSLIVDPFGEVC